MRIRKQPAPMTTQQQDKETADLDKQQRHERNLEIGKQVMHTLGRPANLYHVQVRPLWKGRYRVNVLVGADATSVTCAQSYFVVVDDDGNIILSNPNITRQY